MGKKKRRDRGGRRGVMAGVDRSIDCEIPNEI
jgi:hypothetical protein